MLRILLVRPCLDLHDILVNPLATLLHLDAIQGFRVGSQHVHLHPLAIHLNPGIHHVVDKHVVRGTGSMLTDDNLGLTLLILVGTLRQRVLLVVVDGIVSQLVRLVHRFSQQGLNAFQRGLTYGRVANTQDIVVQPAFLLGIIVEIPVAECHVRTYESRSSKEQERPKLLGMRLADLTDAGIDIKQTTNPLYPLIERQIVVTTRRWRSVIVDACLLKQFLESLGAARQHLLL